MVCTSEYVGPCFAGDTLLCSLAWPRRLSPGVWPSETSLDAPSARRRDGRSVMDRVDRVPFRVYTLRSSLHS